MPRTLQVRDVDDEVYEALVARASEDGLSVPELLRIELRRLVQRPSMATWLAETRARSSDVPSERTIETLDRLRGPWPDAGR